MEHLTSPTQLSNEIVIESCDASIQTDGSDAIYVDSETQTDLHVMTVKHSPSTRPPPPSYEVTMQRRADTSTSTVQPTSPQIGNTRSTSTWQWLNSAVSASPHYQSTWRGVVGKRTRLQSTWQETPSTIRRLSNPSAVVATSGNISVVASTDAINTNNISKVRLQEAIVNQLSTLLVYPKDHFFANTLQSMLTENLCEQSCEVQEIAFQKKLNGHNWTLNLNNNYMMTQESLPSQHIDILSKFFPPNLIKIKITSLSTLAEKEAVLFAQNSNYRITCKLENFITENAIPSGRFFDLSVFADEIDKIHKKFPVIIMQPHQRDLQNEDKWRSIMKGLDYGGVLLFFADGVFELIGFAQFSLIKECINTVILTALTCDSHAQKLSKKMHASAIAILNRDITLNEYYLNLLS
jgi:hypothetical protein